MDALDYLSNFCTVTSTRTKQKAMQTTEIKVRMDCDGCERRVRNAVSSIKGVKSVEVNRKESRVVVRGYVDPKKVLKRVRSTGKVRAQFWPYVNNIWSSSNKFTELNYAFDCRVTRLVKLIGNEMDFDVQPKDIANSQSLACVANEL
ncbi:Heavy metal-associated isoprenylated plant protein 22 [Glycine max]|nr:Heavy metal-associated isoprenylated plant protein 22 [Glycine max]